MAASFFLLLFSALALGQECDPRELERQCYAAVCSTSENFVPQSAEGLDHILAETKPSLALQVRLGAFKAFMTQSLKKIQSLATPESIRGEALTLHPKLIKELLGGDLTVVNGHYIVNDLSDATFPLTEAREYLAVYDGFMEPLSKLAYAVGKKTPVKLDPALLEVFTSLEAYAKDSPEALKNLLDLRSQIHRGKVITEKVFQKSKLDQLGDGYLKTRLRKQRHQAEAILAWKARQVLQTDWSERYKHIADSCLLLSSLLQKAGAASETQKRGEAVDAVVSGFKTKFLPLLSSSTASKLAAKVSPSTFQFTGVGLEAKLTFQENEEEDLIGLLLQADTNAGAKCEASGLFDDHYNLGEQVVQISPLSTVLRPGPLALAHELGHLVQVTLKKHSSAESKLKLERLLTCIDGFHPQSPGLRQMEDFADWFGAKLGFTDPTLMCELKNLLDLKTFESGPTYASKDSDLHSNYLFRALHIKLVGGQSITPACEELMSLSPERPVACEL